MFSTFSWKIYLKVKKIKQYSSHKQVYEATLVYLMQVNSSRLIRARGAGTRFTYPCRKMEGWVDLGGWLHTDVVFLSADGQVVTGPNVEQLTALIETNALASTQRHHCPHTTFRW